MATAAFTETFRGRQAGVGSDGASDFTRVWDVETDDATMSEADVFRAFAADVGVGIGSVHSSGDRGTAVRLTLTQRDESNVLWLMEVRYSTSPPQDSSTQNTGDPGGGGGGSGGGPGEMGPAVPPTAGDHAAGGSPSDAQQGQPQYQENPLLRPAEVEWHGVKQMTVVEFDAVTDEPILNSALDAFDPPVEIEEARLGLTVTRNQAIFDPVVIVDFTGAINSSSWFGWQTRQARCTDIKANRQYENGFYFWKVTYQFEFRKDGWRKRLLDRGWQEIDGTRLRAKNGERLSQPGFLDGDGAQLPFADDPVELTFNVYKEADFTRLHLV